MFNFSGTGMEELGDPKWPPGTVKLQAFLKNDTGADDTEIILQPRPTDNPNDPLNWPSWQKTVNYSLACFYAMMVFAFVNATSPTWGPLADELGFSDVTLTNTYAIGCATLAIGAPMLIPFALKFGSRPVYVVSSVLQCAISIWAARTQNAADWWGVNATQCWLGALSEVLVQITIADVFFVHQRGTMNSIYIWVSNVGQNLAIVAAGFVTLNMGWRWVWWFFAIFFGIQFIMFFFGFEETKFLQFQTLHGRSSSISSSDRPTDEKTGSSSSPSPPTTSSGLDAQEMDAAAIRKLSTIHISPSIPRNTPLQRLKLLTPSPGPWSHFLRHSYQPFLILVTIPGVLFAALCYGILTAWSTVMTTAVSTYMLDAPYSFDAAQIGLMSLAPFIGSTLGSIIVGPVSDAVALRLAKRNNGVYEPEMRFWVFLPFIPFQLAGAWWFAYALDGGSSWAQVAVAYGICNFGSAPIQSLALTYVLDAYNEIVGDALTAITFLRNLFSTIFVFAMPAWIAKVGIPNVFNTIGAIGLLILSFAIVFVWRGKYLRWRTGKVYRYYAERQFEARKFG
ncbi:hypothetical protein CAC42_8034 [Sphaceloma murrayae]|uniref:Major facilitator superfamily (MFS) profile domain-containing protein n=1 Tax=Sphaceloma murrayae TaxID=2082308 RepID=A0A2K1QR33_9PEZI|nr:hypothetical protein CAC42_8034 [Sphaceloma murrayae]